MTDLSAARAVRPVLARRRGPGGAAVQYAVVAAAGLAVLLAACAIGWPAPGVAWPLPLAGYLAAVAAVGVAMVRHYPHRSLGVCNAITHARLTLVALLAAPTVMPDAADGWPVFAVAALALALDGIDGRVARRSGLASAFGARFDVEVDAAFALVLALLAWRIGAAGPWVVLLGLPRYIFVAAASALPWLGAPLPERFGRKVVCVIQLGVLIALVAPPVDGLLASAGAAVAAAAIAWSFGTDIVWLRAQARR